MHFSVGRDIISSYSKRFQRFFYVRPLDNGEFEVLGEGYVITKPKHLTEMLRELREELVGITMHPRKSMLHCFRYINRKAQEYLKQEMEALDEKPDGGGYGGDVPDDLCYQWAVDYFRDPEAEEDKEKEEKFVPKPYYGGGKASKPKKESKPKPEPKKKPAPSKPAQEQISLFGEAVTANAA